MIPTKKSGRPCKSILRRFWDLGALEIGQYRVVPAGVPVPRPTMALATDNTGYTFTARKQRNGSHRIYRVS